MEAANLSVKITGDASELMREIGRANAALRNLRDSAFSMSAYSYGVKNDLFKAKRNSFISYTKSANVPIDEQISWWENTMAEFSYDYDVIKACSEQIFKLTRSLIGDIQNEAKTYIDERTYLNDWQSYGDNAISAFDRIKSKNREFLNYGFITYSEYVDNVENAGSLLYNGRIKQSKKWLEHEEKYNGLSADDYIAGLNRMAEYSKEYYNRGLISWREYSDGISQINDMLADKVKEKNKEIYSSWQTDADMWQNMRQTYGDWDKYGDSEEQFYKRKIERIKNFYAQGIISFDDFDIDTKNASMSLYKTQSKSIDNMLSVQYQAIKSLKAQFETDKSNLKNSWAVADRKEDIGEVSGLLGIYKYAVTTRGQEKYKELQERLKKLQREEQLYELETKNNAIIKSLEEEYRYAEANKGVLLDNLRSSSVDISSWTRALNDNVAISTANIGNTLNAILKAIGDKEINVYNDNSNKNTINLSNGMQVMFSGGRYLYYGM